MFVAPVDEGRRIAHRAEETGGRHLRIADVARIARHTFQTRLPRKVDAAVLAHLSAAHAQPATPQLVHYPRAENVRVTDTDISGARANLASKPRHERLLQSAGPKRL